MEKSSKRQRLPVALKVFAQEPRQIKARTRKRNALSQVVGKTKDTTQLSHLRGFVSKTGTSVAFRGMHGKSPLVRITLVSSDRCARLSKVTLLSKIAIDVSGDAGGDGARDSAATGEQDHDCHFILSNVVKRAKPA